MFDLTNIQLNNLVAVERHVTGQRIQPDEVIDSIKLVADVHDVSPIVILDEMTRLSANERRRLHRKQGT